MSADDFFNRMIGKKPAEGRPATDEVTVTRRQRLLAEQFLDNETLTADLDDEAANTLIDWGMDLSERIAESTRSLPDDQAAPHLERRGAAAQNLMRRARELALQSAPPSALPGPSLTASKAARLSAFPPADAPQGDPETDQVVPPADEDWQQMIRMAAEAYGEPPVSPPGKPLPPALQPGAAPTPAERIASLRRVLEPGRTG